MGCHMYTIDIVGCLTRLLVVRYALSVVAHSWKLGDGMILTESRCDHAQSETGHGFDNKGLGFVDVYIYIYRYFRASVHKCAGSLRERWRLSFRSLRSQVVLWNLKG